MMFIIERVYAASPPFPPCAGLPGCGGAANVLQMATIPAFLLLLLRIAAGLGVIFMIVAGFQMLLAWGDESKVTQGRWAVLYGLLGLSLAIMSKLLVTVVTSEASLAVSSVTDVSLMAAVAGMLLTLFNGLFLVIIALVGIRMLFARGSQEEYSRARLMLAWAIGGAIVVNVSNAVIQAVTTFFGV